MKIFLQKRNYLSQSQDQKLKWIIIVASILSLAAYLSLQIFSSESPLPYSDPMIHAARIMDKAISTIGDYCDRSGIQIDMTLDPNHTGLIGSEISELATTLGNLKAKRTTTNPNFAALIVHLLERIGVTAGDTIAIGCSASFPTLMIASLAAAKAMDIHPIIIISLGASSYGATNPGFNLLNIYEVLFKEKIFSVRPVAISLGGDRDIGRDFGPNLKNRLIQQIQLSGIPFIHESDLQMNISKRMKIYQGDSSENRISAFINIGGSYANIGISELVLKLKPGLDKKVTLPPKAERGVIFEMAARNIPIIHLLYIKGLAMKYGLPWDPIPLPKPGESDLYDKRSRNDIRFWLIATIYFALLIMLVLYGYKLTFSQPIDEPSG